jgi:hypothetical protein
MFKVDVFLPEVFMKYIGLKDEKFYEASNSWYCEVARDGDDTFYPIVLRGKHLLNLINPLAPNDIYIYVYVVPHR